MKSIKFCNKKYSCRYFKEYRNNYFENNDSNIIICLNFEYIGVYTNRKLFSRHLCTFHSNKEIKYIDSDLEEKILKVISSQNYPEIHKEFERELLFL